MNLNCRSCRTSTPRKRRGNHNMNAAVYQIREDKEDEGGCKRCEEKDRQLISDKEWAAILWSFKEKCHKR